MKNLEQDALGKIPTKIRKGIVIELQKDFQLEGDRGFQVEFDERIDIWLPLSADARKQWSNENAVAIMERVFDIKFSQTFQVQLPPIGDLSLRNDVWFPIPANFSLEGWSDSEVKAIAGKTVMLGWSFIPARFSDEIVNASPAVNQESTKEMLVLFCSIHPGMIFEVN